MFGNSRCKIGKGLFRVAALSAIFASSIVPASEIHASGKKTGDEGKVELKARVTPQKPMQGEPVLYEVVLETTIPSIAGTAVQTDPDFGGLEARREPADSRLHEETGKDGEVSYVAVIDRIRFIPEQAASYKIKGGSYIVGVGHQVVVNDPFWGPMVSNDVEERSFEIKPVTISVRKLPEDGRPDDFKGAVGNYTIEIEIPKGDIVKGKEAIAVVTVRGEGSLTEKMLPELRESFPEGLEFNSASPSVSEYVADGRLCSEMEIECLFTPSEEGKHNIMPVEFVFYDRDSKRYERIRSEEIEIEVLSSPVSDSPPVLIEI